MAPEAVAASIYIDAPPEVVFRYLIDPRAMTSWMGEYAELDARPGGRFAVNIRGVPVRGSYLHVQAPHRVVINWGYAGAERHPPGTSTVEFRLIASGDGTLVEVRHGDLPAAEGDAHCRGWDHYLPRLAVTATGADPGPDPGMPTATGDRALG